MSDRRFFFGLAACALAAAVSACVSAQAPVVQAPAAPAPATSSSLQDCGQTKDLVRAIAGCSEAISAQPKDAKVRVKRGFAYFLKNDYDHALADYEEAIRLDPKGPHAFARRGLVFRFKGDDDRAIADFGQAISLGSADPSVYLDRGTAQFAKGNNAQAIADFSIVIERDGDKSFLGQLAHVLRGLASLYSGATDKAQADLRRAVELNPREPFFALFLHLAERRGGAASSLAGSVGKLDMTKWPAPAVRMFLHEGTPDDVLAVKGGPVTVCEAVYFTAEFMLLEGRRDEALTLYRRAVSDCPHHILEGVTARAALRSLGVAP